MKKKIFGALLLIVSGNAAYGMNNNNLTSTTAYVFKKMKPTPSNPVLFDVRLNRQKAATIIDANDTVTVKIQKKPFTFLFVYTKSTMHCVPIIESDDNNFYTNIEDATRLQSNAIAKQYLNK